MKNLLRNSYLEKSRENGRFLRKVDTLKTIEVISEAVIDKGLNNLGKRATTIVKTQEEIRKLGNPAKTAEVIQEGKEEQEKLTVEDLERGANEFFDPMLKKITEDRRTGKIKTDVEMFEKIHGLTENIEPHTFRQHFAPILEGKVIPEDWKNNVKMGGVAALLVFLSKKGNTWEKSKGALKWGMGVAVLTHPAITGAISHAGEFVGTKVLAPGAIGAMNLIGNIVDDPMGVLKALGKGMDGKDNFSETPIGTLLLENTTLNKKLGESMAISQDPIYLWKNGMKFSPQISNVIEFMSSDHEKKKNPPTQTIKNAAEFVARSESIQIPSAEMQKIRENLHNKESISDDEIRKAIAFNLKNSINNYFGQRADFQYQMQDAQNRLNYPAKAKTKLEKLNSSDLKTIIGLDGKGRSENFAEMRKKLPQGIEGLMKNPGGGLLKILMMIWGIIGLSMGGSNLLQKGWKGTKEVRENPGKSAKKALLIIPTGIWGITKFTFGQGPIRQAKKAILDTGVATGEEGFGWDTDKKEIWSKYKDKKKIAKKYLKLIESKKETYKIDLKTAKEIQDKEAGNIKIAELEKGKGKLTEEEFKGLFSGDEEISKKLFP